MTTFLVLGTIGVGIVVLSLVVGDLFEGLFEAIDVDAGGGAFSTPVIGSFLGAFGFGGALVLSSTGASVGVAALAGLGVGVLLAGVALLATRALMRMPTDAAVRNDDLVGKPATVVTAIPSTGYGEIALVHAGQQRKLNARSTTPLPRGQRVVVVEVTSASSVLVEAEQEFWGQPALTE